MEIICETWAEVEKPEIGEKKWNKQKTQFKWKTFHLETMSGYVNKFLISLSKLQYTWDDFMECTFCGKNLM